MKRIFVIFFALIFLPAVSFADGTYIKPLPNLSLDLDPHTMGDNYSAYVASQIYDSLFKFDEFFSAKPNLIDRYQTLDNGKTLIFNLKRNIFFHNGKNLTVDDVMFSLSRFIKKAPHRYPELSFIDGAKEFISGKAASIKGLVKLSNYSFKILLLNQSPTLFLVLATPHLGIVPNDLAGQGESFFQNPIGTGPFKMVSFEKDKEIILDANPNYLGGVPKLSRIIYRYALRDDAIAGFNKGIFHDLQWYNPKPEELTVDYNVAKLPIPRTGVLIFNVRRPPFNNEQARKAFAMVLDQEKLMKECFADKIKADSLIPNGIGGHRKSSTPSIFNIKEAQKITKSLFTSPKDIKLFWIEHHPCSRIFDKLVKKDLNAAGFNPTVDYIPYRQFMDETEKGNNFDAVEVRLSIDYPEAISLLNYFKTGFRFNFGGFSSVKYDELLKTALLVNDKYQRYKIYEEAQKILEDKFVLIPLYYDVDFIVYQKNVAGIVIYSLPFSSFPMDKIRLEK